MFIVRQIAESDFSAVFELAGYLKQAGFVESFNLPHDESNLRSQVASSVESFRQSKRPKDQSVYMFVLEEVETKKILGTSLVFGKHGTTDDPHTYLSVLEKNFEDASLGIKMSHQLLRFE